MNLLKKFAGAGMGGGFPGMGNFGGAGGAPGGFPSAGAGGFPGFPGDAPKPDPKPKQEFDDGLD